MNTEHPKAVEARVQAEKRRADIARAERVMKAVEEFNKQASNGNQIKFVENDDVTICYTRYTNSAHTTKARVYMMSTALRNPSDEQHKALGRMIAFDRLRAYNVVLVRIAPNMSAKHFFEVMANAIS